MKTVIQLLLLSTLLAGCMSHSDCFKNPPSFFCPTCGEGTVKELGGLKTYFTGRPYSKLAVIMISDIYGYEAPIFRKVADKVGSAGFLVVAPDFFHGNPVDPNDPTFDRVAWGKNHTADKGYDDAKPVIAALKRKGVSAIGVTGICWGGKVAAKLAGSDYIQTAVLLHPSRVTIDEIKEVKVPIAVLGAELDKGLPPELLKQWGDILSANKLDYFIKIFPGVRHGWTVRYNETDTFAVKSADEAHQDTINWFTKQLK
ncbi:endo-1,31,4-beta-D-glucanase-like [Melia azedarach]|uniref:Endo-1,31,4-beta-D-glucanase-like n=1 Tax=Melia azedarach TaxID=155640 RepID=A0ACC1YGX6_MELAZ|nr:endo-1,31,4-beta-D-glucanase-like [Melia azedarach]